MKNVWILSLAACVLFAGTALAQGDPCKPCEQKPCDSKAKKVEATGLVARIERLEKCAADGCQKSAAKLAALKKACGTDSLDEIKELAAKYEQNACNGCKQSKGELAKMEAALNGPSMPDALSAQLVMLCCYAEKGCEVSGKILAMLVKDTGAKDNEALVAHIKGLEAKSAKGCEKCGKKIQRFQAMVFNAAPLSVKLQHCVKSAGKGCKTSKATLAKFGKDCGGDPCCPNCCDDQCCPGCCEDLIEKVQKLEMAAFKGDKEAATKLAALAAKFPARPVPSKESVACDPADCKDCKGGCEKGGAECGGTKKPADCGGKKPDCCPGKAPAQG